MSATPESLLQLERHLGRIFVAGLTLSAASLTGGLVFFLFAPQAPLTPVLLNAGLVILMATPILRVVVSVIEYLRMQDWFFVCLTLGVLLELSVTMAYALR
jgi:hypothetical protein